MLCLRMKLCYAENGEQERAATNAAKETLSRLGWSMINVVEADPQGPARLRYSYDPRVDDSDWLTRTNDERLDSVHAWIKTITHELAVRARVKPSYIQIYYRLFEHEGEEVAPSVGTTEE
jgi:hypothetical protein